MATIRLDLAEQAYVDEQVKTGAYKDADAVMREALGLLRKRDAKIAEVRALIQEGVDDIQNGRVHEYATTEDFVNDIRQMAAERLKNIEVGH